VRSSTDTGKELAARFGVSQATISHIRRGHTWRDA
jgi:transcriptional regulator with XRE-family HTH domain